MEAWQQPAVDYIRSWIEFQVRVSQRPGCILAIAHRGKIVAEHAFGHANLATGEKLTPRHRFRIASHTKSFTPAGIMKLREARKLRLDDPVGQYIKGLHPRVAETTIAQILSHSAGLVRDGSAGAQFYDSRPFLGTEELIADSSRRPSIEPNTLQIFQSRVRIDRPCDRSDHQGALSRLDRARDRGSRGLARNPIRHAARQGTPFARGHSPRLPVGRRLVIPGENRVNAITPAAGFVSTAADVARFFAQLAPNAKRSVLSAASRREMTRRHWCNPHLSQEGYYGLGVGSGNVAGWDWFGHIGGLHGYISQTWVIPACEMTICVLTNSTDGWAGPWIDGAARILRSFEARGAPKRRVRDWTGRWWSPWGAFDLVPTGNRVLIGNPHANNPFLYASEIEVTGRDTGRVALAGGSGSHDEAVALTRNKAGKVTEVRFAGGKGRPEKVVAAEMERRYGRSKRGKAR
jgi:CubicO group peptidase (beta-lactamase class C family)